eukprot:UN30619
MFQPVSGMFGCPLAMTDGASKLLESVLKNEKNFDHKDKVSEAYMRLTTRNSKRFWTSGQWMTERKGGSDVGYATETIAKRQKDGSYRLWGYKWFSSSIDANVAIGLARIENEKGEITEGSQGISCFLIYVRDPKTDKLNNIRV